jgi:hypothetical protein
MDIVKKNIVSVIFGVVALVAFIAYFWPIGSMYSDLESKVQERARVHGQIRSLQERPRKLPIVDPDNPQAEQLDRFPSTRIIEQGREVTQQVEQESIRLRDTAIALNRKDPLVRGVFPQGSGGMALAFREAYRTQIAPAPGGRGVIRDEILRAGTPPTPEQIAERLAALEQEMERRAVRGADGQKLNPELHDRQLAERRARLPEQLKTEVATTKVMYMMPDALTVHPELDIARAADIAPSPEDMWYGQVGLWIQRDVARAIAECNEQATNVLNAPVKRLVRIDVGAGQTGGRSGGSVGNNLYLIAPAQAQAADPMAMGMGGMGGGMGRMGMGPAPGAPAAADFDSPLPREYAISPTGRVSNTMYDVVPFRVSVIVEVDRIPMVIRQLGVERFIYVRNVEQIEAVDSALEQMDGFIYGDRPVALLTLDCEAIFLRAWTLELMPRPVRDLLLNQGQAAARM